MFVIDVIPFSKAAPPGTLSYRSKTALSPGTLVSVTLRRSSITAMVVNCDPVIERKSSLKRASFVLSKSEPVLTGAIPPSLLSAAHTLSNRYATSVGSVLSALLSEYVRSETVGFTPDKKGKKSSAPSMVPIEASIDDRANTYAALITEHIGEHGQIHMIVPTLAEAAFWSERFSAYAPLVLTGEVSLKKRVTLLQKLSTFNGLIITTPAHAWLPVPHRRAYIIDRVSAGTYSLPKRPYLNLFTAAVELAREQHIPLIYGDYPLPLEFRPEPGAAIPQLTVHTYTVFDAREKDDQAEKKPWKVLPDEIVRDIRNEIAGGGSVAVLAVRKGYAPTVVCKDCGQAVTDDRGAVLSFSQEKGERIFRSSDGATRREADVFCTRCGSWNLYPLGVGIERVEEQIHKEFPQAVVIVVSAEGIRSRAAAKKTFEAASAPGTIIIGTEAMLPWLLVYRETIPISFGIIASADSLLSLPFWRSRERFVRLLYLFSSLSTRMTVVTRKPDDAVFDPLHFYSEEQSLRKALGYPPFGTLIAVQIEGTHHFLEKETVTISTALSEYLLLSLPDRPLTKSTSRRTWVIKLGEETWPNKALSNVLQQLGPSTRILIDPDSLW